MNAKTRRNISIAIGCASVVGVITTAYFTTKATPRVLEDIENKKKELNKEELTPKEIVEVSWKTFAPAAASAVLTIVGIGANIYLNVDGYNAQLELTGLYIAGQKAFRKYKKAAMNVFGEDANDRIIDEIEKSYTFCDPDNVVSSPGIFGSSCLDIPSDDKDNTMLFYDAFTNRYFESTPSKVLQAQYHANRNFALGYGLCLDEYYDFLGIRKVEEYTDYSWQPCDDYTWIDFDNVTKKLDNPIIFRESTYDRICEIHFMFDPMPEDYWNNYLM